MDSSGNQPTLQPLGWHRLDGFRPNYLLPLSPETAGDINPAGEGTRTSRLIENTEKVKGFVGSKLFCVKILKKAWMLRESLERGIGKRIGTGLADYP